MTRNLDLRHLSPRKQQRLLRQAKRAGHTITLTKNQPVATEQPEEIRTEIVRVPLANGTTVEYHVTNDQTQDTQRACGSCSLCCKLVPIPAMAKPANTRCQFIRTHATGSCSIYHKTRPRGCAEWTCYWKVDPTITTGRPDRCHYVIDVLPDQILAHEEGKAEPTKVPVIQIWVDPAFPLAHRDPGLRAWIAKQAETTGMAAIVRCGGSDGGLVLVPPALMATREWKEFPALLGEGVGMWSDPAG